MGTGVRLFLAAWLAVAGAGAAVDKKFNITVGYLPVLYGELRGRQGLTISGALSLALEEINNSTEILPDVKILLEWHKTKADTAETTRLITDMISSGVVAFFGPEGHCYSEATIAQSKNLPMFSYNCADNRTSKLTNFVRLEPQATKSVISLLRYYRWDKFSILYEEEWETDAVALKNHAKKMKMTVNHIRAILDPYICCQRKLECCAPNIYFHFLRDTRKDTRIYMFLGSKSGLNEMMKTMAVMDLFTNGEYMVIYVDMAPTLEFNFPRAVEYLIVKEDQVSWRTECLITPAMRKQAQSLLVVTLPEISTNYSEFADKVRAHNNVEPFNFPDILFLDRFGTKAVKVVNIHAAYLYDSAKMYAAALDDLIKEDTQEQELSYSKLMRIATNGSRIVARMIKRSPYKSVSSMSIQLDENAEAVTNLSLLAYKRVPASDEHTKCSHDMIPVGQFLQTHREYPEFNLNPTLPIDWAGDVKPDDGSDSDSAVHLHISTTKIGLTAIFLTLYQWMGITNL